MLVLFCISLSDAVPNISNFRMSQGDNSALNSTVLSLEWEIFHVTADDTENIEINPVPISVGSIKGTGLSSRAVNVTLENEAFYGISITARNCKGPASF